MRVMACRAHAGRDHFPGRGPCLVSLAKPAIEFDNLLNVLRLSGAYVMAWLPILS